MGCQITKEEDEKRSDQQSNTEHANTDTMAQKTTAATDYKSRLEWKLCLVRCIFFRGRSRFYSLFASVFFSLS